MDQRQFTYCVESNQRAVRRFLTALCCGDAALADDLAQDAFIKAWLGRDSLRDAESFGPWIFRIAYNTFVSHRRANTVPTEPEAAAERLSGAERADGAFDHQELYGALGRLSARERSAILLHYMQGYDIKEIAAITGSTADAVKQQLLRGRQHLKRLL